MQNDSYQNRVFNLFCHFVAGLKLDFSEASALARLANRDQVQRLLGLGFKPEAVTLYEPNLSRYNRLTLSRPGTNLQLAAAQDVLTKLQQPSLAYLAAEGEWVVHFSSSMRSLFSGFSGPDLVLGLEHPVGPGGETVIWQGVRSLAMALALFPEQAERTFFQTKALLGGVRASSKVRLALREMYFASNLFSELLKAADQEAYSNYFRLGDKLWKEVVNLVGGPPLTFHRLAQAVKRTSKGNQLWHTLSVTSLNVGVERALSCFWTDRHSRLYQARFMHLGLLDARVSALNWYKNILTQWPEHTHQLLLPKSVQTLKLPKQTNQSKTTLWTMDYGLYK